MPRCYMVKKITKVFNEDNLWDQKIQQSNPDSPTEGAIAPLSYTSLTNRPVQLNELTSSSNTILNNARTESGSIVNNEIRSSTLSSNDVSKNKFLPFTPRSAEETEAAHDLLSLSQSLPPLPAPGVVTIHHVIPSEDEPLSTNHSYRPLSPNKEQELSSTKHFQKHEVFKLEKSKSQKDKIKKQILRQKHLKKLHTEQHEDSNGALYEFEELKMHDSIQHLETNLSTAQNITTDTLGQKVGYQERDPVIVENTAATVIMENNKQFSTIQINQPEKVVYFVQVSDNRSNDIQMPQLSNPSNSENVVQQTSVETMAIDETADVIVLPLSPEAEIPQGSRRFASAAEVVETPQMTIQSSVPALEVLTFEEQGRQTYWRPLETKKTINSDILVKPTQEICSLLSEHSKSDSGTESSSIFLMNIPDRRRRRRGRKESEKMINFDTVTEKTEENTVDEQNAGLSTGTNSNATRTKFYKVIEEDIEEEEEPIESEQRTKFCCPDCGKCYATSSNLSRHKQTHRSLDSQSAKKCNVCGKAYVSMPALAMHVLTHKLGHSCDICGKQFSRPWLLQGHLRSHTGEKPYGCAHCGKAFADRSNLRAHMQTHSNEKRFECPNCTKSFALKSYLNKHLEATCVSYNSVLKKGDLKVRDHMKKNAETQTLTVDESSSFPIIVD